MYARLCDLRRSSRRSNVFLWSVAVSSMPVLCQITPGYVGVNALMGYDRSLEE